MYDRSEPLSVIGIVEDLQMMDDLEEALKKACACGRGIERIKRQGAAGINALHLGWIQQFLNPREFNRPPTIVLTTKLNASAFVACLSLRAE